MTYWQRMGKVFGYPQCCTDHFSGLISKGFPPGIEAGPGPWSGTGFIPCPAHRAQVRTREEVVALIKLPGQGREISTPFPEARDKEVDALIEAWQLQHIA